MNKRIKKKMNKKCSDCLFNDLCKRATLPHCKGKMYYKDVKK